MKRGNEERDPKIERTTNKGVRVLKLDRGRLEKVSVSSTTSFLIAERTNGAMVCTKRSGRVGTVFIVAVLAVSLVVDTVHAFAVAPVPATVGHARNLRKGGPTSSFLRAGPARPVTRAREGSPTSLSSSYVVKPEMARSRGSEWRKLRTRGPGFGEKARVCFL